MLGDGVKSTTNHKVVWINAMYGFSGDRETRIRQ
jgi:hypothetical protein